MARSELVLLGSFLQGELDRLLERQRAAILPGAVERCVISEGRTGRGHVLIVTGQFARGHWTIDLLLQSLRRAPDVGGAERVAEYGGHVSKSVQRMRNPPPVTQIAPEREALPLQRLGRRKIALIQRQLSQAVQRGGDEGAVADLP